MAYIDDAFKAMTEACVDQLGLTASISLRRVYGGTLSAAVGHRTGSTTVAASVRAIRKGDERIDDLRGQAGGVVNVEQVEYFITRADLLAAADWQESGAGDPAEGDFIIEPGSPDGDGRTRKVVNVQQEASRTGWRVMTRGVAP